VLGYAGAQVVAGDMGDEAAFLNNGGGYGVDISHARSLHPPLLSFEDRLAAGGRAKIAELFDTSATASAP
jgi:hypothetical protein